MSPAASALAPPLPWGVSARNAELRGAGLVALSSCMFGITAALVRLIAEPMPQLMQARYLVGWVTAAAGGALAHGCGVRGSSGRPLRALGPPHLFRVLAVRTVLHWLLLWAWWVAVRNMPLGDATAIGLSGPVLTALLANVLLGESLPSHFTYSALCAAVGVLLVADPHGILGPPDDGGQGAVAKEGSRMVGLMALSGALAAGSLLPLFIRISGEAHWLEVEHFTAAGCALAVTPMFIVGCAWVDPAVLDMWSWRPRQLALASLLGVVAFTGLGLQTRGFQLAPATRAAMAWYAQIPFCYMLQWGMFGQRPAMRSAAGALLVVVAALLALTGADADAPEAGGAAADAALATPGPEAEALLTRTSPGSRPASCDDCLARSPLASAGGSCPRSASWPRREAPTASPVSGGYGSTPASARAAPSPV